MRYLETHEVKYDEEKLYRLDVPVQHVAGGDLEDIEGVVGKSGAFMHNHTRILMWEHEMAPSKPLLKQTGVYDGGLVLVRHSGLLTKIKHCTTALIPEITFDELLNRLPASNAGFAYLRVRAVQSTRSSYLTLSLELGELRETGSAGTGMRSYDIFANSQRPTDKLDRGKLSVEASPIRLRVVDPQDTNLVSATFVPGGDKPHERRVVGLLDFACGRAALNEMINLVSAAGQSNIVHYAYIQHARRRGSVLDRAFFKTTGSGKTRVKRQDATNGMIALAHAHLHPLPANGKEPGVVGRKKRKKRGGNEGQVKQGKKIQYAGRPVPITVERVTQIESTIVQCAPTVCGPLLTQISRQVFPEVYQGILNEAEDHDKRLHTSGVDDVLRLLEGLAPLVSVESMLPRTAVPVVRRMLAYSDSCLPSSNVLLPLPTVTEQDVLRQSSPEVFAVITNVLMATTAEGDSLYCSLKSLLVWLCDDVERLSRSEVAPPPFEAQPGTYNPPKFGIGLQFSESGERGRYTRQYSGEHPGEEDGACTKDFAGRNKRTGGIFTFFCPHGYSYGSTLILEHEGRRDPFQCLYTHMASAPAVIIYDFACQLSEYVRNREPAFFANTRYCS